MWCVCLGFAFVLPVDVVVKRVNDLRAVRDNCRRKMRSNAKDGIGKWKRSK